MANKNNSFAVFKWLVMLAAYGFLIYKLANIEFWLELKRSFLAINGQRTVFLAAVLLLMPLNWMLEVQKWQILTSNSVKLSFRDSLKAVLAGLNTGFITPNRIGEFAGRILFLPDNHRLTGVLLSFINSLTQTIVMTFLGVIGAVFYYSRFYPPADYSVYLVWTGVGIGLCLLVYFAFPGLIQKIKSNEWSVKLQQAVKSLSSFKTTDLMVILFISMLRYAVFSLQFYFMLKFFQIDITLSEAIAAIPAMYLLVTYTPSFAASEPAIRGSYAVLIFSVFSDNVIGIMLAGVLIWLINFVIPMLAGSVVILKTKSAGFVSKD